MTLVLTYKDPKTGKIRVDHGVNSITGVKIVLPDEEWEHFKTHCYWDEKMGAWILKK